MANANAPPQLIGEPTMQPLGGMTAGGVTGGGMYQTPGGQQPIIEGTQAVGGPGVYGWSQADEISTTTSGNEQERTSEWQALQAQELTSGEETDESLKKSNLLVAKSNKQHLNR
eukprot:UN02846